MAEETTRLADLPAEWEAEAEEIDERLEAGEISGEVWEARVEILTENAVALREALALIHAEDSNWKLPSSVYRLSDWLVERAYPEPKPQTNDIADWALAKLAEQEREIKRLAKFADSAIDEAIVSDTIEQ